MYLLNPLTTSVLANQLTGFYMMWNIGVNGLMGKSRRVHDKQKRIQDYVEHI